MIAGALCKSEQYLENSTTMTTSNLSVPSSPAPVKVFNQSFLDIHDPTEFAGVLQPQFSIAYTYTVDKQHLPAICDELYTHVLEKVYAESVGKVSLRTVDYVDGRYSGREAPRRYIVVESDTNRGTRSSIFIRFLPFGENLYVAVDSYVLGTVDWLSVFMRGLITLIPILIIFAYLSVTAALSAFTGQFNQYGQRSSGGGLGTGFFCCCVPAVLFLLLLWLDVFRAFKQHGNLALALRQNFSKTPNDQSFNVDDVLMFFKSALPLVIFSVRDVLKGHGLEFQTLDDFVSQVNNVVTISSGGGILSIIGSAVGGKNNRVSP
jgi:hypothetical protein